MTTESRGTKLAEIGNHNRLHWIVTRDDSLMGTVGTLTTGN